jgi:hypothetical protein
LIRSRHVGTSIGLASFKLEMQRREILPMNRRDAELLERQLHSVYVAPRGDGVLMLVILAVFFAGIALGGFI